MTKIQVNSQGKAYVTSQGKLLEAQAGGGDIVTATNTTGASIAEGDKVWLEKVAGGYNIISSVRNYAITGTLTDNNKVISGFSTSNYISLYDNVYLGSDFEIAGKFKTASNVTTEQNIAAGKTNQYVGLSVQNGEITFNIGNGSSWLNPAGSKAASVNTEYWYKIIYKNGKYSLQISEDGVNYTQTHSLTG